MIRQIPSHLEFDALNETFQRDRSQRRRREGVAAGLRLIGHERVSLLRLSFLFYCHRLMLS